MNFVKKWDFENMDFMQIDIFKMLFFEEIWISLKLQYSTSRKYDEVTAHGSLFQFQIYEH